MTKSNRALKLYINSTAKSAPILKLIFLSKPTMDDHCKIAVKPISVAIFLVMSYLYLWQAIATMTAAG